MMSSVLPLMLMLMLRVLGQQEMFIVVERGSSRIAGWRLRPATIRDNWSGCP